MATLLEAQDLSFSYGRKTVWEGLGLSLVSGEVVSLRGVNGSGKSTLLRCLAGQLRPREGEVCFLGRALFSLEQEDLAGLSLVPDVPALYDDLTGHEHLELVARELYAEAYFGAQVSEGTKKRVARVLPENIAAFKRLAKFSPYLAGDQFTLADCAGWVSLPLVALTTKTIYGEDFLAAAGVDWKAYAKLIGERPHAMKVTADRKADQERRAAAKAG